MIVPVGKMVWWRFTATGGAYRFGYVSLVGGGLVRMGRWNGDYSGGSVVDPAEIEWKAHD